MQNFDFIVNFGSIILNRNSVPNETGSPMNPSGIRLGTPIVTTRGMKEKEMEIIAALIDKVITLVTPYCSLKTKEFTAKLPQLPELKQVAQQVRELCEKFPLEMG